MAMSAAYTSYLLFPPVSRASSPSQSPLSSSKSIFISNGGRDFLKTNCNAVITSSRAPRSPSIHCLFGLGVPELVVIAGVAALVFGPKKLPEIGRSIGKTVKSFQQSHWKLTSDWKWFR